MDCTNQFYAKHVLDEISLRQKEDKDKSRAEMASILKRVNEQTTLPLSVEVGGEEWSEELLDELQRKIEKGEPIELTDLPEELRERFMSDIATSCVSHYVEHWKPWWLMPENLHNSAVGNLIQEVNVETLSEPSNSNSSKYEATQEAMIPCIRRFLKHGQFKDVSLPVQLSPCLPYHCMQVILFYCLYMRLYNGDIEELEMEIVEGIFSMSTVLSKTVVIPSAEHLVGYLQINEQLRALALATNQEDVTKPSIFQEYILRTLFDVMATLEIPHFAIDVLAHCSILFHSAYKKSKRKELLLAHKKLVFFTTYLRKMSSEETWLVQKEVRSLLLLETMITL